MYQNVGEEMQKLTLPSMKARRYSLAASKSPFCAEHATMACAARQGLLTAGIWLSQEEGSSNSSYDAETRNGDGSEERGVRREGREGRGGERGERGEKRER